MHKIDFHLYPLSEADEEWWDVVAAIHDKDGGPLIVVVNVTKLPVHYEYLRWSMSNLDPFPFHVLVKFE